MSSNEQAIDYLRKIPEIPVSPKTVSKIQTLIQSGYGLYDVSTDSVVGKPTQALVDSSVGALRHVIDPQTLMHGVIGPATVSSLEGILNGHSFHKPLKQAVTEISDLDVPTVVALAGCQFQDNSFLGNTAIRTVFGGSPRIPLRALSYLLPALHMLEGMHASRKCTSLPQIQYIIMRSVSSALNDYSFPDVQRQSDLFIDVARRFIDQFFPQLSHQVVFATDDVFMNSDEVMQRKDQIMRSASVQNHPLIQRATRQLLRSGHQNVLEYLALHPLVHDIAIESELFEDVEKPRLFNNKPSAIFNIGGQKEKMFYGPRQVVLNEFSASELPHYPSVQFFSGHRVPPYTQMPHEDGYPEDILLEEAIKEPDHVTSLLKANSRGLLVKDLSLLQRATDNTLELFLVELQ
ncbi:hypothetical protein C4579_01305 [Candidatus Microgenomates bacterium]|nr:MAG: hypothetical protein C4579_01305 [Candidatus Microgenomates bacterium]